MRIYLASSWRNPVQQTVLKQLRQAGHEVYDFRNPKDSWSKQYPGDGSGGFQWTAIDPEWQEWSKWAFTQALNTVTARRGFQSDFDAMERSEIGVLLLPSGRSAHIEAGYFAGHPDKSLHVLIDSLPEPELMYLMANGIHLSVEALIESLRGA